MQRPSSINLTAGLMVLLVAIGLYSALTFPIVMPPSMSQTATPINLSTLAAIVHGIAICFSLIALIFVLFYWLGHEWARWAVMIYSVWTILHLFKFSKNWQTSHLVAELMIADALLGIFLLWHLNTVPIKAWFKGPKTEELAA
jgi:hypothetical protein